MRVGQLAGAGEEQAEGQVRGEVVGVGGNGLLVGGDGSGVVAAGVFDVAEVVEEVGVGRVFVGERGEQLEGGGEVLAVESFVGLGKERVGGGGGLGGAGVRGAGRELRLGDSGEEGGRAGVGASCGDLFGLLGAGGGGGQFEDGGQPVAGVAGGVGGDLLGGADGDDLAASAAALGAHVDHPVGGLDDVEIVLDHEQTSRRPR